VWWPAEKRFVSVFLGRAGLEDGCKHLSLSMRSMITRALRGSATRALLVRSVGDRVAQLLSTEAARDRLRQDEVGSLVQRLAHRRAPCCDSAVVVGSAD